MASATASGSIVGRAGFDDMAEPVEHRSGGLDGGDDGRVGRRPRKR